MREEPVTPDSQGGGSDFKSADGPVPTVLETPGSPPGVEVATHPDSIDENLLHEQQQHRRNSSSTLSSLNQDWGDDQQLEDNAESRDDVLFASGDENEFIFAIDSQFAPEEPSPRQSTIGEASNYTSSQAEGDQSFGSQDNTLQHDLSISRVDTMGGGHNFLPLDCLGKFITKQRVLRELRTINSDLYSDLVSDPGDLSSLTAEILKIQVLGRRRTTRRKIFAILVMMKRPEAIIDVIREKIYDDHLPFRFGKSTATEVFSKEREGEVSVPITFFRTWDINSRDSFKNYQFEIMVPYFRLSWKEGMRVYEYALEPGTILPFIHDDTDSTNTVYSGGTSFVQKLKIHPAHHNCKKRPPNPYFAVKTLRLSEESAETNGKDLTREALALKRFVDLKHDHLVRLLATYTHRGQFHLIFPWAEGNLLEFWKHRYPDPTTPERNSRLACWLAMQLQGLASALKSIHLAIVHNSNNGRLRREFREKKHGRHGDLKPENILWFEESNGQSGSMGVLKISDFGLADFHRTDSVNITDLSSIGGLTPTYRAPEHDIAWNVPKKGLITPRCDIWSLGCVFLEFVTWYLRGWDGVEKYAKLRQEDSCHFLKIDDFFNSSDRGSVAAEAKRSVADAFRDLKSDPDCSDFMLELLEFTQDRMLKMNARDRATCDELLSRLTRMTEKCTCNIAYCTERTAVLRHRSSDLSVATIEPPTAQPEESGDSSNTANAIDVTSARSRVSRVESDPRAVHSRVNERSKMTLRLRLMKWARDVFRACCCIEDDA